MIKVIAIICLLSLMTLSGLGNFWFTYGIWPQSWLAFVGFYILGLTLSVTLSEVIKHD